MSQSHTDIQRDVQAKVEQLSQENGGVDDPTIPDSKTIRNALRKNEAGDAILYKILFDGVFVFNQSLGEWMFFNGHHWMIDKLKMALASTEAVARLYEDEARVVRKECQVLSEDNSGQAKDLDRLEKDLKKRAFALRSSARRKNLLDFAANSEDGLSIVGHEVDQLPWKFACGNGVVNLKLGELESGDPKDMLLSASSVNFDGIDAEARVWEQTLDEVFSENKAVIDCFQRICGYALYGGVLQSIFIVLVGRGRNGKGVLLETIKAVLGELAISIRPEMLLDQYKASSGGPSPDVMALRGARMAIGSETDSGAHISTSKVKLFTGDDTLRARNPHDKYETEFRPTHLLFLATNNLPHAPAEDYAFWQRMLVFPFENSFVDREPAESYERRADPFLKEKLKAEYPGILAWMVRGNLIWQNQGIDPPAVVKASVDEYRRSEDILGEFIETCCVVGEGFSINATRIYQAFEQWWGANVSKKVPKQRSFGAWFGKRFEKKKEGTMRYYGVALLENSNNIY